MVIANEGTKDVPSSPKADDTATNAPNLTLEPPTDQPESQDEVGDGYVRGAEAEELLRQHITAPGEPGQDVEHDDSDEPPPVGIVGHMKKQTKLVRDLKQMIVLLSEKLDPVLAEDKEKETSLTEPLEGSPSALLQQVWENNSDISKQTKRLRNIINGVQL